MILFFIGWIGSFCVLSGLVFLASKKASNPKKRMQGQIVCSIGCFMLSIVALFYGTYDLFVTNIGVFLINSRGILNCKKEIRKGELNG